MIYAVIDTNVFVSALLTKKKECSLFPNNYKDFTCWDGTGEYFYTILDGF